MIVLQLPWPPTELSPNARSHWAKTAKHKAIYRSLCASVVDEQRRKVSIVPDGPLSLLMEFCPPTKRSYDRDNLSARMKSGLDGLCDSLRFDDSRFDSVTSRVKASVGKPGFVTVTIREQVEC